MAANIDEDRDAEEPVLVVVEQTGPVAADMITTPVEEHPLMHWAQMIEDTVDNWPGDDAEDGLESPQVRPHGDDSNFSFDDIVIEDEGMWVAEDEDEEYESGVDDYDLLHEEEWLL